MTNTHLESFRHVCSTDLIVLVSHVTTFQLAGLVDLKDALPALPPLSLLLWAVPSLFILVLFLLLALVVSICIKVCKVKVATKDFLGLLEGSVGRATVKRRSSSDYVFPWLHVLKQLAILFLLSDCLLSYIDTYKCYITQTSQDFLYELRHSRIRISWELLAPLFGDWLAIIIHDKIIYICLKKAQV